MESKVSARLGETIAPELQRAFSWPTLSRTFPAVLPTITAANKAHLVMLRETGILSKEVVSELMRAVLELEAEGPDAFDLDPALEDSYFNYEAELIRRVGADLGGRLHVARSRNDLKATQDRMLARDKLISIMGSVMELRSALIAAAETYHDVVMPGYTHTQPAQPVTFGWYLLGVAFGIERDFSRLADTYGRVNRCPMGAGAFSGVSFAIDRPRVAALLGFDDPLPHALDAVATRDTVIETLSSATFLMTSIGRMAQDFYNMSTYEFATLSLSDRVATTSSIMPQKKNLSALENLKARPAYLAGALTTAFASYKGVPYSHTQDGNLDSLRWAWDALTEVDLALPAARVIVESVLPCKDRMMQLSRENFSTATELADFLVREADLSFRDAHHVVSRVVRLAIEAKLTSDQVTSELVDQASEDILGRRLGLSQDVVSGAMDPALAIENRYGSGGPSRSDMSAMLDHARGVLADDHADLEAFRGQLKDAETALEAAIEMLCIPPARAV